MTDKLQVTEEELETCGLYEPCMRKIAMFSVANDFEAHGLPMPPNTDTLLAQNWCRMITQKIGASYVAHIPYSTDMAGDVARNWSPRYIPFDQFYEKLREFVAWHLPRLSFRPEKAVIIEMTPDGLACGRNGFFTPGEMRVWTVGNLLTRKGDERPTVVLDVYLP